MLVRDLPGSGQAAAERRGLRHQGSMLMSRLHKHSFLILRVEATGREFIKLQTGKGLDFCPWHCQELGVE